MQSQHIVGSGEALVASRQASPFPTGGLLLGEAIAELEPQQQAIETPSPAKGIARWVAPALAVVAITAPADPSLIKQFTPLGLR